ncbi:MAG: cation:proton antiporter [Oscillospiraceae bacterium]|jgi:Kef-type K+ transport system membrane component KefB
MESIFYLGLAMAAGLLMTRLTRLVHLPNVTAYLIAGLLIGPYVLGLVDSDSISSFSVITSVALGFIAFSIGDEFKLETLKKVGKSTLIITLVQSLGTVFVVDAVTLALGFEPAVCVVLGALAAATAPAATLLVVRQYKASGPLTTVLLPVVAADDAVGLIAYSISVTIAQDLVSGNKFSFVQTILMPLLEIILALVIGALMGFLAALSHRLFRSHTNRMSVCIAGVFLCVAAADYFGLSSLLVCMAYGAFYVNLRRDSERILACIDDWTYPLFMLFFVISGAELDLTSIPKVGVLGIVYILTRMLGKWLGAYCGALMCKEPPVIRDNLGFALLPQAGVAIGMATLAVRQLPQYGSQIQTIVLAATFVFEIIGPIATKFALKRAGEIHAE